MQVKGFRPSGLSAYVISVGTQERKGWILNLRQMCSITNTAHAANAALTQCAKAQEGLQATGSKPDLRLAVSSVMDSVLTPNTDTAHYGLIGR